LITPLFVVLWIVTIGPSLSTAQSSGTATGDGAGKAMSIQSPIAELTPTPTPTPESTATTDSDRASAAAAAAEAIPRSTSTPESTVAAAPRTEDTAMFRANPAHTGEQRGPAVTAQPEVGWAGPIGEVGSAAAVSDGVAYVSTLDGSVYALESTTGEALWQVSIGNVTSSSPAVVGDVLYVGSGDGR